VFRRRSTDETPASTVSIDAEVDGGKGRPTPTRKEAEAARRQRVRPTLDRRATARRDREARRAQAAKTRLAMQTGDEAHYTGRDRGPVRGFIRDFVDSRRSVAEFFLPLLLVVLVLSFFRNPTAAIVSAAVWLASMLLVAVDLFVLGFRLRREVRRRFPEDTGRGHTFYGVIRATQLRRLRLPKPRVKAGAHI